MKKIIILICTLVAITGCGCSKKEVDNSNININEFPDVQGTENIKVSEDGTKVNNSSAFSTKKTYNSYEISEASISTASTGRTTFKAIVKNTSSDEVKGGLIDIIFLDKNNNEVSKISTYVRTLKSNESMDLNAGIDKDLSNAYNFRVEEYKK